MAKIKVMDQEEIVGLESETGTSLLEVLQQNDIEVDANCGGNGICGKCKVKVKGEVSDITIKERDLLSKLEIEKGIRLACLTIIEGDVEIGLLDGGSSTLRILDEGDEKKLDLDPMVEKEYLELEAPSLGDQISDWTRIIRELGRELEVDLELLEKLPNIMREADYNITVVKRGQQVIQIEEGDTRAENYGLAFDIGTTTVVGYLLDLNTGEQVGKVAIANRQNVYGSDALARVNHTIQSESGADDLQQRIIKVINEIISKLIDKYGIARDRVYELIFVGNTIMNHLLLGLKTEHIAKSPYVSVINEPQSVLARKLGIELSSEAPVTYLPNVASYVGSDIVAGLLTSRIDQSSEFKLLVDLGTNSEIVLGNQDRMMACAAAAGPAFEGAEIKFGMNGIKGAIEEVRINDELEIKVIGDQPPKGICGSGIISLLAELLKANLINKDGKLLSVEEMDDSVPQKLKDLMVEEESNRKLILVKKENAANDEPITISQKDIRAIQLAQGAIRAGIKILLKELEVEIEDIKEVLIAGGFGNYIQPQDAVTIGVLPTSAHINIHGIGNAAGSGAKAALLSREKRNEAKKITREVEYLELSSRQDFQTEFMNSMVFERFEQD